jgi:glucosylceramidase
MKDTGQENGGGSLLPGMDAELAEFFSVYLSYLEAAGHPLDWLSIQNEPEAAPPWDSNTYGPDDYASTAEAIAQRLVADGHATRLVAPDTAVTSFTGLYLASLAPMPTAMERLDAAAFHLYQYGYYEFDKVGPQLTKLAQKAPPGTPLWMTEFSNTTGIGYGSWDEGLAQAQLVHESFVHGASMYVMWNLYRPGGPGEALVVIPTTPGASAYTVTPKYWTLRQFTRYVRPGAQRIGATSADAKLLVSAYRDPTDGKTSAVLINTDTEARWALFEGARAELGRTPLVVRSSEAEQGVELAPDSPDRFGPRALRVPARSVATVVWPHT